MEIRHQTQIIDNLTLGTDDWHLTLGTDDWHLTLGLDSRQWTSKLKISFKQHTSDIDNRWHPIARLDSLLHTQTVYIHQAKTTEIKHWYVWYIGFLKIELCTLVQIDPYNIGSLVNNQREKIFFILMLFSTENYVLYIFCTFLLWEHAFNIVSWLSTLN